MPLHLTPPRPRARPLRRAALAAALTAVATLTGCAGDSDPAGNRDPSPAPVSSPADSAAFTDADLDAYAYANAAHVCTVQQQVYDEAGDLAAAYNTPVDYQELTPDTVARIDAALEADPVLRTRVNTAIQDALADCS